MTSGASGVTRPPSTTPLKRGFSQAPNRAYLRDVQPESLVSTHVNRLADKQSDPFLRKARERGAAMAAKQGSLHGASYAAAAEDSAYQQILPMASQDASTYNTAELADQSALNQAEALERQQQVAEEHARANASAIAYAADRDRLSRQEAREDAERERQWRTSERLGTQDYSTGREREGRSWQVEDRDTDYGFRREDREDTQGFGREQRGWDVEDRDVALRENQNVRDFERDMRREDRAYDNYSRVRDTVLSDPDLWRDQEGSAGFMNFFSDQFFNEFMDRYFPRRAG